MARNIGARGELRALVRAHDEAGLRPAEIARLLGVTVQNVLQHLQRIRSGAPDPRPRPPSNDCPRCGMRLSHEGPAFTIALDDGTERYCSSCGPRRLLALLDELEERDWAARAGVVVGAR